jgi:hypothetical protein
MILPLGRRLGGLFGLLAQLGAIAFWVWMGTPPIAGLGEFKEIVRPTSSTHIVSALIWIGIMWGLAAGIGYGLYRQFRDYGENLQLLEWLKSNGEKIREGNPPVFYRGHRVGWDSELVCHHRVFSLIVISTRSKTRWLIKGKQSRTWPAWEASLYTLFYGWWGVPGLIWALVALIKNMDGSTRLAVRDIIQPPPPKPKPHSFMGAMKESFKRTTDELFLED